MPNDSTVNITAWIRLLRPGEWIKNVFVFPAVVFALPTMLGQDVADESGMVWTLIVGALTTFVAFCLISSAVYAINDVVDVEQDRRHPVKKNRPVASGELSGNSAIILGIVLGVASLALAATVNLAVVFVLATYAVSQAVYNAGLKRVMLVDVITVALGFALRATAGAVAIDVQISVWLLLCVFFLCLYLGFIKRLCDLTSAEERGGGEGGGWSSPAGYDNPHELNWLLCVSSVLAIVTYLMYALSDHAWSIFGSRAIGFALLSPLVMIAVHRFYRRALKGTSDSPLDALRTDRVVLATVLLFTAGILASLYVPWVQEILDRLFIAHGPGTSGLIKP